jgi:hypothetical protein
MRRRGTKQPYKPKVEYKYTVKDIAELAGMTRNAVGVAKAHGKVDPADFKSAVSFLVRRIIDKRLSGNLFAPAGRTRKRVRRGKGGNQISKKKTRKTAGRN